MDSGQQNDETDFLFDIVVTSLDLEKPVKETELLEAQVKFGGVNIKITNSRINVQDFINNRLTQFTTSPSALRQSLEDQGMQISARYAGSSLGTNVLLFPDTFIDKISSKMNDLFFEATINLMRRADCIGTITIRLVLIIKCIDTDIIKEPRRSSSPRMSRKSIAEDILPKKEMKKESCQGLGPTINPQDVMFVIGDPDPLLKIPSEPCSELLFEDGDVRLDLDLQRYRSLENRRLVLPDDDPCLKEKPSISQLRQLTHHYSRIIGMVSDKIKKMHLPSSSADPPSEKIAPISSTPQEPMEDRIIPVPIKDDTDNDINPIRFCPFCLYSMSWLPKYANCPRCNAIALPELEEHHSRQITADEIVEEQLVKPKYEEPKEDPCQGPIKHTKPLKKKKKSGLGEPLQISSETESDEECPPCRCTCSADRTCAHCRIRRMCEDVFNSEKGKPQEQEHIKVPSPREGEDFCVITHPSNDRTYLSRVLNELKYLYHKHDTKKLLEMQKRCESQTLLPIGSRSSITLMRPPSAFDPHVPGTFNRQTAGHRTCLPDHHLVPRHHGWNWPRSWLAKKYGWRPGAILRAASQVMRFFLMGKKDRSICKKISDEQDERERRSLPILNICKKDGVIFVTLRALPTLDMKQRPITFRIVKSELAVALRQIKRALKDQGFRKCTCHKSLMLCTCRDALEKFELNKALKEECQRRIMEPCPEHLVLTDTSISDLEFNLDVTPPAGTRWPKAKALQNMVNHGTQTQKKGIPSMEPKYPVSDSPYWRAFDCAAGDRYMGTAFGDNVETVFEDGIFGYRGGGQHGKAPCPRDPRIWGKRTGAPMPIGTGQDAIDPYRFTRTVWKTLPKNIIRQMHTNRQL
ncbi:uncharacterized protein LOC6728129 [Drosophila simulans]|uniref:GD20446 n=1 Tax=Drosophila simulans TaxID=7240 RepID=B4R0G8_DROSI|nr:uncharacterized protein LOC6728129 [Drosophila simulans]EDX12983.1 GD20446 [Drosophila simulans]KMZ03652.1 uncharacterized protein Dsimw501_GD20446 [Drosophila simulans]